MKKPIVLFMSMIALILLTSCSNPEKDYGFQGMDSKAFFESITLPEKLSIDINLDEIRSIDEAKTYKAKHVEFDKETLINAFIRNSIVEEKNWAEGPQIIAYAHNIKEILSIYDGGKSFGTATGMKGGFAYLRVVDDTFWEKLDIVANVSFLELGFNEQHRRNSNYASYVDLEFLPYKDALADIRRILDIAGMPEFDVDETYSLDLRTMTSNYRLYLDNELAEDEKRNINWTKDDESYIFSLRQLVDNIPIVNKTWQKPDGAKASAWGNPMPSTNIRLIYDNTGIRQISAYNILNIVDEIENSNLINVFEALSVLIENYALTILEDDIRIISAELMFLSIPRDNMVELVPGWVFRSAKDREVDGIAFTQYKYDVVNAITGMLYPDRW